MEMIFLKQKGRAIAFLAMCFAFIITFSACNDGNGANNGTDTQPSIADTTAAVVTVQPVLTNENNYTFTMKHHSTSAGKAIEHQYQLVMTENGWCWIMDNITGSMFINEGAKLYTLDCEKAKKTLKLEGDPAESYRDGNSTFSEYYSLLTSHNDYDLASFNETGTEKIAGIDCKVLSLSQSLLPDNSSITYWVDSQTGMAMKYSAMISAAGSISETSWELTEFIRGSQTLDSYIAFADAETTME